MNGAYRDGIGNPVKATYKSARWLTVPVALVLAVPALFAFDIYLIVTGALPERLGAAAVLIAGLVVLERLRE